MPMLMALMALFNGPVTSWGLVDILCMVVIVAACVALVAVGVRKMGWKIPEWLVQVFVICIVAVVIIFAIRFVASL
jgi:hypothetical protein